MQSLTFLPLIIINFLLIAFGSFYFWIKIRKLKPDATPTGFVLLVQTFIRGVEKIVINALGHRFVKVSSYIIYLFIYINMNNLLSLLIPPFYSPLNFLFVIFSLGIVTLIGIFVFGFHYKGAKIVFRYLNPLEVISTFTSFISMSLRLFGNIFSGFLVMSLIYGFLLNENFWPGEIENFNFFAILIAPLHIYFDFFSVFLHTIVFVFLTLTYWSLNRPEEDESHENQETINEKTKKGS